VKCPYCEEGGVLYFCINPLGLHVVSCIPCAKEERLEIVEKVMEAKSEILEKSSSHKG